MFPSPRGYMEGERLYRGKTRNFSTSEGKLGMFISTKTYIEEESSEFLLVPEPI